LAKFDQYKEEIAYSSHVDKGNRKTRRIKRRRGILKLDQ